MATDTLTKFHSFAEALAHGVHDLSNDQIAVALVAAANAPDASSDAELSDLTQISYTNLSSRNVTTTASEQTGGTYKLTLQDLTLTASGEVGPFRYAVLYNDDAENDELIGYLDYGSDITLQSGETFTLDFDGSNGVFTIA